MASRSDQQKAGIPRKRRGQQTGFGGNPDQNREEMEDTPALRGRRKEANKMFADKSSQHVASDATKPSSNSPSTTAMINPKRSGGSGGARVFKQRLARQEKAE
jgi:hypothetical protein